MLAVISSPHGFEITLSGAATLSQAHLIQRGFGTGGRTPGKSLLSRVLTATHATFRVAHQSSTPSTRGVGLVTDPHLRKSDKSVAPENGMGHTLPRSCLSTQGPSDGEQRVAQSRGAPGPAFGEPGERFAEDLARAGRILTEKPAHLQVQLDTQRTRGADPEGYGYSGYAPAYWALHTTDSTLPIGRKPASALPLGLSPPDPAASRASRTASAA